MDNRIIVLLNLSVHWLKVYTHLDLLKLIFFILSLSCALLRIPAKRSNDYYKLKNMASQQIEETNNN